MVCNFIVVISALFRVLFRLGRKTSNSAPRAPRAPALDPDSSNESEEYNSGEYTIGYASTGLSHGQTETYNLTTFPTDTSASQLTELEGVRTQSYSLGSNLGSVLASNGNPAYKD
ncbi:hypothetical protein V5O48_005041 [Marasmius crinis-equi]|uniref:Uncharacterized protein n=1 Tax=Marasmius crinis-equi TaxID=585013 RepID=A0ABR3FND6_9AGAR